MFIKPVAEFLVSPLTFVITHIKIANFPDAWKTLIIHLLQLMDLKHCRRFFEDLVLKEFAVSIEKIHCTINFHLNTEKISPQQRYY